MPMASIFAQTDIRDDDDAIHFLLNGPDRPLDDSLLCIALGSEFVFFLRDAEEDNPWDSEGLHFFDLFDQEIDRELKLAGHGRNGLFYPFSGTNEEGKDKVIRPELGIPEHPSKEVIFS
jgi:hypothetical protein